MWYLQAKNHLKNTVIHDDLEVSKENHEEVEFGTDTLQKRVDCLNHL